MLGIPLVWRRASCSATLRSCQSVMRWISCGFASATPSLVRLSGSAIPAILRCRRWAMTLTSAPMCRNIASFAMARWPMRSRISRDEWADDLVTVALGCSFTFENALMRAGYSRAPYRERFERADVPHQYRSGAGGPVSRQDGRDHAPHSRNIRSPKPVRSAAVFRRPTARRLRSVIRQRSGSRICPSRIGAMRSKSEPAKCRSTGPAA